MSEISIVEPDPVVAEFHQLVVRPLGLPTRLFRDADEFLAAEKCDGPACVILRLPPGPEVAGGPPELDFLKAIADRGGPVPVAVCGAVSPVTVAASVRLGAIIVDKSAPAPTLRRAVVDALREDAGRRSERSRRDDAARRLATLDPYQRTVLAMLFEGHSNREAAARLRLGLRTVERYRATALDRLGAVTLVDAALALSRLAGRPELGAVQAALRDGDARDRALPSVSAVPALNAP